MDALLVVGFAMAFGADATSTTPILPLLYVYALVDAVEYLLPGLAFFVAGLICKKKFANKENNKA